MVVIKFYQTNLKFDSIADNFEDFTAIFGATVEMQDPHLYTYEYTLDNKTFFLLNKESYFNFYIESSKATIYVYSSKEETHYFKEKQKQNEQNKIEIKQKSKTENITENESENKNEINVKIKSENKNENIEQLNDNLETKITKEMVYQRILQNQREKMRLKALEEKNKSEKKNEIGEEKNTENKFENLISDAISKTLDNPKFKEQLINESKIMCSKILTQSQIQKENEKNDNDNKRCDENEYLGKHPGIICSLCEKEIIGDRYLCVYCKNLNYCSICESKNGFDHGHPMFKLKSKVCD